MPDAPEVVILPQDTQDVSKAMRDRASDFTTETARVFPLLSNEDGLRSFGADPRNPAFGQVAVRHDSAVAAIRQMASGLSERLTSLGQLTTEAEARLVAQDDDSATDIAR